MSLRIDAERACRARGAVCTPDGRPLSAAITASIRGLAGISVADAATDEGPDAAVEFSVTLSRASSSAVSVDYQTVDGGAKSGQDYTAASGTLTVAPGQRSKTVRVAVLDDEHDEGSETFTLRLSNPSNGKLNDGEATGTIRNRDPLPNALLARFGRAAAGHVVEQVQARMEAPREKGLRGRFAGQELAADSDARSIVQLLSRLGQPGAGARGLAPPGDAGSGWPAAGGSITGPPGGVMLTSAPGAAGGAPAGAAAMRMQGHGIGLIEGSALSINRKDGKGGTLSFWSQGAESRFTGRDGRLGLEGDVRTTMVGTDYARGSLIVGLSIGRSWGTGSYQGVSAGRTHSAVTGVYPWLGYKFNERVSVWGVTGYGRGRLALTPQGGQTLQSPLTMRMSAAGARGLLKPDTGSGMSLAFKADALQVVTAIDEVEGPDGRLAATRASVSRVRTALEAAKRFSPGGRIGLQPSVEIGVRRDAGDAENGSGIDLGSGLIVADRDSGLSIDIRVRTVVAHQAEGFSERGVSVAVSYDPTPATPLGWTAGITPAWGGETASGSEALWARETMTGMGALQPIAPSSRFPLSLLRPAGGQTIGGNPARRVPDVRVRTGLRLRIQTGHGRAAADPAGSGIRSRATTEVGTRGALQSVHGPGNRRLVKDSRIGGSHSSASTGSPAKVRSARAKHTRILERLPVVVGIHNEVVGHHGRRAEGRGEYEHLAHVAFPPTEAISRTSTTVIRDHEFLQNQHRQGLPHNSAAR